MPPIDNKKCAAERPPQKKKQTSLGATLGVYKEVLNRSATFLERYREDECSVELPEMNEQFNTIYKICNHVIDAGFIYVGYFNQCLNNGDAKIPLCERIDSHAKWRTALDIVYIETRRALGVLLHRDSKYVDTLSIKTRWGMAYGVESLLEHAIVHVLRHEKQIRNYFGNSQERL